MAPRCVRKRVKMYTEEEKLNIFKYECRRYDYYLAEIRKLENELTVIITRMEHLSSPAMERVGSNPNQGQMNDLISLIETKNGIESKLSALREMTGWITGCIDRISYPAYRMVVWDTFVKSGKLSALSDTYGISEKLLSRNRKRCILQVLDQDTMEKYDSIHNLLSSE